MARRSNIFVMATSWHGHWYVLAAHEYQGRLWTFERVPALCNQNDAREVITALRRRLRSIDLLNDGVWHAARMRFRVLLRQEYPYGPRNTVYEDWQQQRRLKAYATQQVYVTSHHRRLPEDSPLQGWALLQLCNS